MGYPDYKRDLLAADFDATRVLHRYFHSRSSAVFQGAPLDGEIDFNDAVPGWSGLSRTAAQRRG